MAALRRRAALLDAIRAFFRDRGVLEVETPVLSAAATTDPNLRNLETTVATPHGRRRLYLQTSPEAAMKRLLAAGSGSIFQMGKVFRDDEAGRLHNPEFTLLEWYRVGFDHHALMDEVEALVAGLLGRPPARRDTYREVLMRHAGVDCVTATPETLHRCAAGHGYRGAGPAPLEDADVYLDFLMGCIVAPRLGREAPQFVYDFPAGQAAMARIRPGSPPVAERFELYVGGIELANGYHELGDADEQRARMIAESGRRRARDGDAALPDERLLAALRHGLPDCAGVALGVDRLLLLKEGGARLDEVLAFPADRA